jgi:hypothetical protein
MQCIMVPDLKPPADDVRLLANAVVGSLDEALNVINDWLLAIG